MEERSLFHRMRQIFREEGETEEVGTKTEYTYDTTSEWTEDQPKTEVVTKG